ncbi:hypothetical protein EDD11_004503 [Mortierella claussenii]|nr:hypothetical protein EDD11_004503 [Mortierella claussenii]
MEETAASISSEASALRIRVNSASTRPSVRDTSLVEQVVQNGDDSEAMAEDQELSTFSTQQTRQPTSDMDVDQEAEMDSDVVMQMDDTASANDQALTRALPSPAEQQSASNTGQYAHRIDLGSNSGAGSTFTDPGSSQTAATSVARTVSVPVVDEKAQSELRRKIMDIQRDPGISFADKAGMIQKLMSSKWQGSQRSSDHQKDGSSEATADDLKKTYYDASTTCVDASSRLIAVGDGSTAGFAMTTCHEDYIKTSYQCPTCWKSLGDMSAYYSKIDSLLVEQTMPPEYANIFSIVLCNDCEVKSEAPYHFLYHKCDKCKGYNTKVLETFKRVMDGQVQVVENATASGAAAAVPENNISGSSNGHAGPSSSAAAVGVGQLSGSGAGTTLLNRTTVAVPRSPLIDENASGDMTMAGISGNTAP